MLFHEPSDSVDWDNWNGKLEYILKTAIENGNYQVFDEITRRPEKLIREIYGELKAEGFKKPEVKVLYSLITGEQMYRTVAAVSENSFQGECLLFHLHFQDEQLQGIGVDFGGASLPGITLVPIGENRFSGYNFRFQKSSGMAMGYDNQGEPITIAVNGRPQLHIQRVE
jgi:hypothetical protein